MDERGFSWGKHDCCLAACDVVLAMTGTDPGEYVRGRYSTPWQAAKLFRPFGGLEKFVGVLARLHEMPEVGPRYARRGDAALVPAEHGWGLGVVLGREVAVAASRGRARRLPAKLIRRAWRV
jgi:hypothetical protein